MSATKPLRQVVVYATIGSFSVAALLGVAALLTGGAFGETELRILLTTLVVGCASIAVLLDLSAAGTRFQPVGVAGGVVTVVPTVCALVMIWGDLASGPSEGLLKTFLVGLIVAGTLAQVAVLLVLGSRRGPVGVVPWATIGVALLLAAYSIALVFGQDAGDTGARLYGVVAILDVLGTVVTIALAVFGGHEPVAEGREVVRLAPALAARLDAEVRRSARTREDVVAAALTNYLDQSSAG